MYKLVKYIHKHEFFPVIGNGKNLMSPVQGQDLVNVYYDMFQNRNTIFGNQYNLSGKREIPYVSTIEETTLVFERKVFIPLFTYLVLTLITIMNS
ncbi:MAG: hypothetical protein HOG33_06720 [Candidatus Marinimicrobia bacterium]|nr:hypothetical protein [Candidatus Neomarinimicrobiota bacterium]